MPGIFPAVIGLYYNLIESSWRTLKAYLLFFPMRQPEHRVYD